MQALETLQPVTTTSSPVDPYAGTEFFSHQWLNIERERSRIVQADPTQITHFDSLVNFFGSLPGGFKRFDNVVGGHMLPEMADRPYGTLSQNFDALRAIGYSDLWGATTPRQFFAKIDELLPEIFARGENPLEISTIETLKKYSSRISATHDMDERALLVREINGPILIPLYLELREIGFSHQDLVA